MINPFKKYINQSHIGLIESFISLSVLNGINIILPLITLPYLVQTIGLSRYGAYSIVYTILQYVLLISAYGFNYTTTKQIAQNRNNIDSIRVIFISTILARLLISIPAIIVGLLLVVELYTYDYYLMYIGGIGIILGDILNPVWLFQGYEKMRYMIFANLICKVLFTLCIFIFVRYEDDYIYITILNSAGFIISGIVTFIMAFRVFDIKFVKIAFKDIVFQIKEGRSIFLSTIFMNVYRNSNIFILGFFISDYNVGIYSAAEKVVKAVQSVAAPISNALFPHLSSSFKGKSKKECALHILSLNKKIGVVFLAIAFLLFYTSGIINQLLFDNTDPKISELIRYMSPVILIGGMNYLLGIAGLVNMDCNNYFLKSVTISGIASLLLLIFTVPILNFYSGAISMIMAECILFIFCLIKIKKLSR